MISRIPSTGAISKDSESPKNDLSSRISPFHAKSTGEDTSGAFEIAVLKRDGDVIRCTIPCSSLLFSEGLSKRFLVELKHLYLGMPILLFHLVYLFFVCTTVYRNYAYSKHRPGELLWDLGFETLPQWASAPYVSEKVLLTSIVTGMSTMIIVPILSSRPHSMNIGANKICLEALTMASIGHTLRFFTFGVTGLPGPAEHCRPGHEDATFEGSIFSLSHPDKHNCGDLIFSGHMLFVITMACGVTQHRVALIGNRMIRFALVTFMWTIVVFQALCIIMAHNHYSVDVVVASYVTPLIWHATQSLYASAFFQKHCHWYFAWYKYDGNDEYFSCCTRLSFLFGIVSKLCSKAGIRVRQAQKPRAGSEFESDNLLSAV